MKDSKKEAQSKAESVWDAYNEPHELTKAEWTLVFVIFAIIIGKTLIAAFGGI